VSEQSTVAGFPDLVRLDRVGTDHWRAAEGLPSGFGLGLLGARAMVAAGRTVDTDWRWVHSVHLSQLATPDSVPDSVPESVPGADYRVDRVRDDAHLSTRLVHVTAGEDALATVTVSFQVSRRGTGPSYQAAEPPELPDPHGLPGSAPNQPVDVRHFGPGRHRAWVRVTEELPDRILAHTAALLLATDLVLPPHDAAGYRDLDTGRPLRPVVVDRVLRVHRSFRADDWVHYEHESPSASDYRTYATGRFHSSMGRLIASLTEESVLVPDLVAEVVGGPPMTVGAPKGA
jgi:acyl-CoA thioesterase-2